ncbi:MAG: DMT family transporter [Nitrospiraceae bacterium]|nr:DMT family transporter [Nitrospiraceae bacterium]MCI0590279.1 DMT family transporter [Gammaproteobacteria bacterium]
MPQSIDTKLTDTNSSRAAMPLWLVYSLLALLGFGVWGLFSTAASKRLSPWQVQVFSTFGMVPVAATAAFAKGLLKGKNLRRGIGWALFTGAGTAVANVALFTALSRGAEASIIFPLTGIFPLVTILIAWVFLRERVGRFQKGGIGMALVAILLFSMVESGGSEASDINHSLQRWIWMGLSLICLLGWGVTGVTQKLATQDISNGLSMASYVVANLVVAVVIALAHPLAWSIGWSAWALCLAVGLCFGLGTLFLFAAYPAGGKVSTVSTLGSLYPAITVVFAIPLFGERVSLLKGVGIVMALAAGVVLSRDSSAPAPSS